MDSDDEEIVLNPSDDERSTPSPLVLGRYAKKKAHWNFIDKDEKIATRMARNGALQTDESADEEEGSDLISEDSSLLLS